jgi:DNA-binding protein H-NS
MLAAQPTKRPQAEPKYRHPENAELTWTGHGRKPGWIAEALEAGKSLDDFAI